MALLTASAAPALPGTFYWPPPECVQALEATSARQPSQCFAIHGTFRVNQHSLQQALEPQGVIFKKLFADNTYSAFSVIFPSAEPVFVSTRGHDYRVYSEQGVEISPKLGYLSFWEFVRTVAFQNPVEVEGWDNPTVYLGEVSFQVGTEQRPVTGAEFYANYLQIVYLHDLAQPIVGVESVYIASPPMNMDLPFQSKALELTGITPGVYGLVTILAPDIFEDDVFNFDLYISAEVVRVGDDSRFTVELPGTPVHVTQSFEAEPAPGTAVLVKLGESSVAGRGLYDVVAPERISVREIK